MLTSSYSPLLVACSLLVAIIASYTALDMAGRITTARGRAARWWLAGGACAMGVGIWSMHFIGMLAFTLPIPLGYDPAITLLSMLVAIASSTFALWLVCQQTLPWTRLVLGAVLMGLGIATMHYTGMAAMLMSPGIEYTPSLFLLSVGIAIVASGAALWIAFQLRLHGERIQTFRGLSAVVMGFAIVGMHYTGMAAAEFPIGSYCRAASGGLSTGWLAFTIIIVTLAILAIALITSVLDMRLESRTSKLTAANQQLEYLALHDSLTGLPNRTLLEDRLDQAIHGAQRERTRFALMYMDLDGFKSINDRYGHSAGDRVLIEVAKRIRANVRAQDTIARLGGDEFVLLADAVEPADAAAIADKLLALVQEPFTVDGNELRVSVCIGIAMHPGDGATGNALVVNADAAMYHAKSLGRNAFCFFEPSMNTSLHEQLDTIRDLRLAVERNELVLHYLPKFAGPSGGVIGAEALLRWKHPTRGLVEPHDFMAPTERSGLIVSIGDWVVNEACRQMKAWRDEGRRDWIVSVDLSPAQFGRVGLIRTVRDALHRHGLEGRHLMLELPEAAAMPDADAGMAIVAQLHAMGVHIAIDDFGSGCSSLLCLKRLAPRELKIDRRFVDGLERSAENRAIVSAIIAVGHTLGLEVVAQGVQTAGQHEFLTRVGCDALQGPLLGTAKPASELIKTLPDDSAERAAIGF